MKRVKEASLQKVVWLCSQCMGQMELDSVAKKESGKTVYLHICPNGHVAELDCVYPHFTIDGELIDCAPSKTKVLTQNGEAIEIVK